jgi:hypothetical protein
MFTPCIALEIKPTSMIDIRMDYLEIMHLCKQSGVGCNYTRQITS